VTEHLYLIDTSVWVELLRRTAPTNLTARVRDLIAARSAASNRVIDLEILVGARDEFRFGEYQRRLGALIRLEIDAHVWARSARTGYDLRRKGVTASVPDLVITATALVHGAVVMHVNGDFDHIAKHSPLRVESYKRTSA
jgi:predicted nucleic acid-binding protein